MFNHWNNKVVSLIFVFNPLLNCTLAPIRQGKKGWIALLRNYEMLHVKFKSKEIKHHGSRHRGRNCEVTCRNLTNTSLLVSCLTLLPKSSSCSFMCHIHFHSLLYSGAHIFSFSVHFTYCPSYVNPLTTCD